MRIATRSNAHCARSRSSSRPETCRRSQRSARMPASRGSGRICRQLGAGAAPPGSELRRLSTVPPGRAAGPFGEDPHRARTHARNDAGSRPSARHGQSGDPHRPARPEPEAAKEGTQAASGPAGPPSGSGPEGPRGPAPAAVSGNRIGRAIQRMEPGDLAAALHPFPVRPVAARTLPRPAPMIGNARTRWTLPHL